MRRAFVLLWHGLTAILAGVASWFTMILGMKDDSRYGKFLRRVVGTSFAIVMAMSAAVVTYAVGLALYRELPWRYRAGEEVYDAEELSRGATYYSLYGENGYVRNARGKKTVKDIDWLCRPLGTDSLACFKTGDKRGYLNIFTGEVAIPPQYAHAWIFSDGLACVDDEGWLKFVDATGQVAIDLHTPYSPSSEGYVFHNGHCAVPDGSHDAVGLIDRQGNWALEPKYDNIACVDSFWIVTQGEQQSVLNASLETVVPLVDSQFEFCDGKISETTADHVIREYNLQGELINDFCIRGVKLLTYETDELRYTSTAIYDEEGNMTGEQVNSEPSAVEAVARCREYCADYDWYGLLSPDGKVITPPVYSFIKAIGSDLYLCEDAYGHGSVINGKGERVR